MANSAGGSGDGRGDGDHRHTRSLEGLLKFALESTAAEDAPGPSTVQMTDEGRGWLQEAIQHFTGNDPVKQMLVAVELLTARGDSDDDVEIKMRALEDLQDYCEDIDLARDFHKIGGYTLLLSLLQSTHANLRWNTAALIGTVVQNNPYCQKMALDEKLLPGLLRTLDTDDNVTVRVKALYAISCMTRDVPEAQDVFVEEDGFSSLMRAMQSGDDKLATKAAFMLSVMCMSQPKFKDVFCDMGMVEQLVGLLVLQQECSQETEHNSFHEQLMGALVRLTEDHPRSTQECRQPQLELKGLLERNIKQLQDREEHQEAVEYSRLILQRCFGDSSQGSVDR